MAIWSLRLCGIVIVAVALAVAVSAHAASNTPQCGGATEGDGKITVCLFKEGFIPKELSVKQGAQVFFRKETAEKMQIRAGELLSPVVTSVAEYRVTFSDPGTVKVTDVLSGKIATIHVLSSEDTLKEMADAKKKEGKSKKSKVSAKKTLAAGTTTATKSDAAEEESEEGKFYVYQNTDQQSVDELKEPRCSCDKKPDKEECAQQRVAGKGNISWFIAKKEDIEYRCYDGFKEDGSQKSMVYIRTLAQIRYGRVEKLEQGFKNPRCSCDIDHNSSKENCPSVFIAKKKDRADACYDRWTKSKTVIDKGKKKIVSQPVSSTYKRSIYVPPPSPPPDPEITSFSKDGEWIKWEVKNATNCRITNQYIKENPGQETVTEYGVFENDPSWLTDEDKTYLNLEDLPIDESGKGKGRLWYIFKSTKYNKYRLELTCSGIEGAVNPTVKKEVEVGTNNGLVRPNIPQGTTYFSGDKGYQENRTLTWFAQADYCILTFTPAIKGIEGREGIKGVEGTEGYLISTTQYRLPARGSYFLEGLIKDHSSSLNCYSYALGTEDSNTASKAFTLKIPVKIEVLRALSPTNDCGSTQENKCQATDLAPLSADTTSGEVPNDVSAVVHMTRQSNPSNATVVFEWKTNIGSCKKVLDERDTAGNYTEKEEGHHPHWGGTTNLTSEPCTNCEEKWNVDKQPKFDEESVFKKYLPANTQYGSTLSRYRLYCWRPEFTDVDKKENMQPGEYDTKAVQIKFGNYE